MISYDTKSLTKAVLARDPRADGRFYVGVTSTGIYCRPSCPARPLQKNMRFYRSAAEAESQGYRACLRCRPDISPEHQLWHGTEAVVGRALRLIDQEKFENISVTQLSKKLGMTERHLRRLFEEQLGASPLEIMISKRLHLARQLLAQTALSITEISGASGFGSLRQFNQSFKDHYQKSPRDFRNTKKTPKPDASLIVLQIPYLPPFDWLSLLKYFKNHEIHGVEKIENNSYHRVVSLDERLVEIEITDKPARSEISLVIRGAQITDLRFLMARIRILLDLNLNPAILPQKIRGRLPGSFDPFESAVGVLLGQLVSTEQARALMKKLIELYGRPHTDSHGRARFVFPSASVLKDKNLSSLGIPRSRASAIHELARRVSNQEINLDQSTQLEKTRAQLLSIKGIGPWSVEMIALRCLQDANAFPATDLIVVRALQKLKLNPEKSSPWRGYLAIWIWKNYALQLSNKKGSR